MISNETVYFSAPLHLYGSERYDAMLRKIRDAFPHAEIFEPCKMFEDHAQWGASWRTFLEMSDRVAFMTDEEGWIGRGSLTEISGAKDIGLEVVMVTDDGMIPLKRVRPVQEGTDCWRQQLRVTVKS